MLAERVIEDGFSFLVLVGVLAFLWFHGRRRKRPRKSEAVQRELVRRQAKAA